MKTLKWLGVSVAAIALVACESPEDKAVKFAENAQEYVNAGDLDRARLQFANALKSDPNNIVALKGAASVAEQQEKWGDQLRFLQRVISIEPDNIEARAKVSRLNLLGGNAEEAIDQADRVLEVDATNLEALTVKGAAQVLENNLDGASETLELALEEAPDNVEVRNLLAARYVRDEDFARADQIIDEGLAQTPDSQALLVVKLLLSQRRQDAVVMGETFQQLIAVSPDNGFYRSRYAEFLLLANRDLPGAREQLEAALPLLDDKTEAVGRLIGIVRAEDGDDVAETRLREIVAQYSDDERLLFATPSYLCEIGEAEACKAELQSIADNSGLEQGTRASASVQLGELAFAQRDFTTTRGLAEGVLEADGSNPDALTLLGKVQLAEEDYDGAIENLRSALNNEPGKESAMILLGLAYEANGRPSFGEAQLAQAIDRNGLTPALFQAYRSMLARNGKADEAADLTLRFAQTSNATAQVRLESAGVLLAQDRLEEAETVARGLLRTDPSSAGARRVLAATLLQQERTDEAVAALDGFSDEGAYEVATIRLTARVLTEAEETEELRSYLRSAITEADVADAFPILAQTYITEGNNDEAIRITNEGIAKHPDEEALYLTLHNIHKANDRSEEATAALVAGLANASSKNALRLLRSNEMLQQGDRVGARDMLVELRDENALNDLTANNLAALMLDLGDDPAEALAVAQRFEDTEQPFFADTLAWAYYKTGNVEKAAEYAEIAAGVTQPNAEILYHRGVIAAASGNADDARALFTEALEAPGKTDSVNDEAIQAALNSL